MAEIPNLQFELSYNHKKESNPAFVVVISVEEFLWAAQMGNNPLIIDGLQQIDNVNVTDGEGNSALHLAVINNHRTTVEILVRHLLDVDLKNAEGKSPLQIAEENLNDQVELMQTAKKFPFALGITDSDLEERENRCKNLEEIKNILETRKLATAALSNAKAESLFYKSVAKAI